MYTASHRSFRKGVPKRHNGPLHELAHLCSSRNTARLNVIVKLATREGVDALVVQELLGNPGDGAR